MTPKLAKRASILLPAVALAYAADAASAAGAWRLDPVWDDGNAEFCAYEVDWRRYGRLYPGRALMILVKEPWAPDLDVKADEPRADGFEVLKLNHIRDVPTGIYTYHQMASTFIRRDDGSLIKLAATSSEGCGISTAQVVDGELSTRSYFDGQGEQSRPYPGGAVPDDALAMTLRDLVGEGGAALTVFPSLMAGRYPSLEPSRWQVRRRERAAVEVPGGTFAAVEIELARGDERRAYTFDARPPHQLLALRSSDGTEYRMLKCERIPYWRMNDPAGGAWLPEAVR